MQKCLLTNLSVFDIQFQTYSKEIRKMILNYWKVKEWCKT